MDSRKGKQRENLCEMFNYRAFNEFNRMKLKRAIENTYSKANVCAKIK